MKTIKSERTRLGLTQKQLSEITGIPQRTIEDWEGGQRKSPPYVEKMILDKLNQMFDQPDYKTILEEVLEMMEGDVRHLNSDIKQYVQNVIDDIKDSLK